MKTQAHFKIILLLLLVFLSNSLKSQVAYKDRIEFETKDGYEDESITTFGKDGFIMSSKSTTSSGGETEWKYDLYNTNLKLEKTKKITLGKRFREALSYSDKENLYSFYKDKKGRFEMITVSADGLEISRGEGRVPKGAFVRDMVVLGDQAFLWVNFRNKSFVYKVNCKTGNKTIIPILIQDYGSRKIYFDNFQVLPESKEVLLFVNAKSKRKINTFVIHMTENGEKGESINLTEKTNQNLLNVTASNIGGDEYVYTGTYSGRNSFMSEGIFLGKSKGGEIEFIQFYTFAQLKEFFSFMSERAQDKIERKKKRKEKRGNQLIIQYRIAGHKVIKSSDGYLFLGEAFFPTYRTETRTVTTVTNGVSSTSTQTYQVFDGYQYTHASLTKFNEKGELLWDRSFEMWPEYKPFFVKRFISIAEQNENQTKMVFASHNRIISKSIANDGTVLQDITSQPIETGYEGDKAKRSFSNIDYWYDNFFIAFGNQVIKNKEDKDVKRKRKVYFVSKVEF